MKIILLVTLSLAAFAAASPTSSIGVYVQYLRQGGIQCRRNCRNVANPATNCEVVNCPPAVRIGCQEPDCSLPGNILRLHPTPDPNYFYQCRRTDGFGGVEAIVRPCACGTVFSARVDDTRCVHPWEWLPDCPEHPPTWRDIVLSQKQCRPDCETCGDGCVGEDCPPVGETEPPTSTPGIPSTTPGITGETTDGTVSPTTPGPDNCQCPCMPCVWWPCMPCLPVCPCNGNNDNRLPTPGPAPRQPQNNWQNRQPHWFSAGKDE